MASNNSTTSKEENEQPKASEIIANNYDLATQILLLTPPASISNLRFTSKLWHSITIDPTFIKNHTRHHPLEVSGLFVNHYSSDYSMSPGNNYELFAFETSYDYNETDRYNPTTFGAALNSRDMTILQSCNGLLLCEGYEGRQLVCYVCYPTTLQRKRIELPEGVQSVRRYGLNLAFDPRISSSYKIVCIRNVLGPRRAPHRRNRYQVEVYSSETGHWKKVGKPFIQLDVPDLKSGVFCKGAVHWLTNTWACRYFDLNHEYMKSTTKCDDVQPYAPEYFGQSHDQLYTIDKLDSSKYNFLEMREDYSTWFIKYVINTDVSYTNAMGFYVSCTGAMEFDVLCIGKVKGGNDVDESDVEHVISLAGKILRFNPRTNASTEVGDFGLSTYNIDLYGHAMVHGYFETICPV